MHRRKAAVGVEVKQVIGSLCRLLAACGLEAVPPPETFRRAKFDGGAAVVRPLNQTDTSILMGAPPVPCVLLLLLLLKRLFSDTLR